MTTHRSRRSFLAATAGTGALALGAWTVSAQEPVDATYRLRMTDDGWVGREPEEIADTASPTLEMEPAGTYRIEWENQSSQHHNLVVTQSYPNGVAAYRTDFVYPDGSQDVTFTATPGTTAYFCEQHVTEVGPIAMGGAPGQADGGSDGNETQEDGNVTDNATKAPENETLSPDDIEVNVSTDRGEPRGDEAVFPGNLSENPTARFTNISGLPEEQVEGGDLAGSSPEPAERFVFSGIAPAWVAQAPQEIQGDENPALDLDSDETYEVVWINGDGAPHNWMIETDDDETLVRSQQTSESGSWQTVRFVASDRMYQYYCQFHPVTMRGDTELGGDD